MSERDRGRVPKRDRTPDAEHLPHQRRRFESTNQSNNNQREANESENNQNQQRHDRRRENDNYRGNNENRDRGRGGGGENYDRGRFNENQSERRNDNANREGGSRDYNNSQYNRRGSESRCRGSYGGNGGRGGHSGGFYNASHQPGPIELCSNYFQVNCLSNKSDWIIYQYNVIFPEDLKSKSLCSGLLKDHDSLFNNSKAFDGTNIYSLVKLPNKRTVVQSRMRRDNTLVDITIDLVKEIFPGDDQTIQIFNIIFRKCLRRCNYNEFGKERAFYNFDNLTTINAVGNAVKILSGYKTSIEIYGGNLFLCAELASRLLDSNTVLNKMEQIWKRFRLEEAKAEIQRVIVDQTVITNYNKRSYKIDDIDWDSRPTSTFKKKDGTEISYAEYYRNSYNLVITNLEQPLLISRPKQRDINRGETCAIRLIPELCSITGQCLVDRDDFNVKRQIDAVTKLNPQERFRRLTQFLRDVKDSKEAEKDFNDLQMQLGTDLVNLTGEVLKEVEINFKNNKVEKSVHGWDREIKNAAHLKAIDLKDWCIFYMERDKSKADYLDREIIQLAKPMGFQVANPKKIRLSGRNSDGRIYVNEIRSYLNNNKQPQLIVCIINDKKETNVYSAIKRTCCIDYSIPSQIISQKNIDLNKQGKTKSVLTKVAIQMNCKLGGEIWGTKFKLKKFMVIGIDLYKDTSDKNRSALAFVASMNGDDQNCSRFFSRVVMQPRRSNYCEQLRILMQSALEKYQIVNNYLPGSILIYRDGVGDSQLIDVKEFEIDDQVRSAFNHFHVKDENGTAQTYKPKLVFIVVQKRGNTRFFYNSNGQYVNSPMGTLVDKTVTGRRINRMPESETSDFYLVSQSVTQGTVSPSHFRMIANEHGIERSRNIQEITYMLTHMYYNWPGQIRVPAVCQYAHKLAHLVGESLHNEHNPELNDRLFYL